jgi:DNA-directed RNA polymerase subunit M/transcription elongation factor TFIIS
MRYDQSYVKVAEDFEGTFECRHCEFEAPAIVRAKGATTTKDSSESAHIDAQQIAEMDAGSVAARTLTFVKCPRCGKTDPIAHSFRLQVLIGAPACGALAGVAAYFLVAIRTSSWSRERHGNALPVTAFVIGVVVAFILYWRWGRAWRNVEQRVTIQHTGAVTARVVRQ